MNNVFRWNITPQPNRQGPSNLKILITFIYGTVALIEEVDANGNTGKSILVSMSHHRVTAEKFLDRNCISKESISFDFPPL
mmetsp:Transcript_26657/g.54896  ORF Transcript_26657/g.54896 Transcript_26657/m.54896 type:complete len:81 (+) Transcript_26657:1241-1483(+)